MEGEAPAGNTLRVLPDGCVDVLVELGEGRAPARVAARVVGAMQRAVVVPVEGPVCTLGVRFHPGGAAPLLRVSLDTLTDGGAALGDVWGARAEAELTGRVADAGARGLGAAEARVRQLEALLLARLSGARRGALAPDAAVRGAVARILASRGAVPVGALARGAGVSARTLERRFAAAVGLTPKVLCRVARLQHAVGRARGGGVGGGGVGGGGGWAAVAAEAGYADQAHLVREFRALVGVAPSAWAREGGAVASVQDGAAPAP
jgi:AraC-like DNA-binding protein